ncbi:MAG: EamA family transporter [Deltaproteobacteria bacterium]|nr:EamA family transporter [Deltaproteobacteria bacterium]
MYVGEFSALLASIIWAIGATFFAIAVKDIGHYKLNFIRLNLAFLLILITEIFANGTIFPHSATTKNIIWLSISGVLGLSIVRYLCH